MTDAELIQRVIDHDENAFRLLVDKYQSLVYNACYHITRQVDDAEDIAQEVFIEVFESAVRFRHESKLSTWLYRIAINKSLNYIRKNKWGKLFRTVEHYLSGEINVKFDIEDPSANDNPENIETKERRNVLQKAIDSLSTNQRIAFTMHKIDELSYQEIADIMELSLSSVESLIHRAKLNLQNKLLNYYKN
jgi:RNA polymerase sigma-70 factor (ECF subfamily)